ncbi:hypothetical protein EIQ06_09045 [Xanthomonas campestris pv. campestris]|nr:hypothetical protein AEA00_02005 [Xanthomonas campestris pv. campestris]PJR30251.1 hypothetical protein ASJ34_01305 [Xanthomonas campestris pv. campestris]QCX65984.1 hypothetical protein DFG55_05435 [Xanthomonas campestris pv. campestris]QCX69697.1 hypothetical protein DFG54_01935 [Xanthomonas campestris pv. campestris]RFF38579.1 hypothetical protein D0A42_20555 [Xanthomonas campestris pv. campestris]
MVADDHGRQESNRQSVLGELDFRYFPQQQRRERRLIRPQYEERTFALADYFQSPLEILKQIVTM